MDIHSEYDIGKAVAVEGLRDYRTIVRSIKITRDYSIYHEVHWTDKTGAAHEKWIHEHDITRF